MQYRAAGTNGMNSQLSCNKRNHTPCQISMPLFVVAICISPNVKELGLHWIGLQFHIPLLLFPIPFWESGLMLDKERASRNWSAIATSGGFHSADTNTQLIAYDFRATCAEQQPKPMSDSDWLHKGHAIHWVGGDEEIGNCPTFSHLFLPLIALIDHPNPLFYSS